MPQTVARHLGLDSPVGAACEARAVLGRDIALAHDVRVLFQKVDCNCGFFHVGLDGAAAVRVDVREVQRIAVGHLHRFDHAFDIGAVRRGAGMPGNIGAPLERGLDELGGNFGREGVVTAQKLDAQGALFERSVDERFHLALARRGVLKRERGRSKLQNRHIDARAVLVHIVENVLEGPCHIQARRYARHRKHPRTVKRAPHCAQMHVAVDDARLQHEPGEVNRFAGLARAVFLDGGNQAVFHGHIHHFVDAV